MVVGLGSGVPEQITPEVDATLRHCDTVAGYSNYVDFIRDRIIGKPIIQNGMMGEVARCRATLEAAAAGQEVCMVCSGDPGILAMAGLLFELRAREPEFADIPIRVLPGITAANIAAASLGAPLQNGFSLVSLSDLLVPSDEVRQNLPAVAQSALPVTLYNPAGRKRRHLLRKRSTFSGNSAEATYCAPMSDMLDGLRRPNGSAGSTISPPTRWICPPSSSSAARARSRTPGPCTRRGGMLRSIWSRFGLGRRTLLKKSFPSLKPHPLSPKDFCVY
ncbi:MAG: precorrin-3B C(17)-methyltransferase [Bilophila wadsworthia]